MRTALAIFIATILAVTGALLAQGPPAPPISQKNLIDILKSKEHAPNAVAIVESRGVDFELDPEIEKQLRKAKATEAVIEAVKKGSPKARAERAAAQGYVVATPEEERDLRAIQDELNPDVALQLAAEFEKKYPQSPLLTYALALSAAVYEQKGDLTNVIAQSERSLALKSDNLMTLLILAQNLPQPQALQKGNVEEKLERAEKYAKQALEQVEKVPPQATESTEQFAARKSYYMRDLHSSLGMVHMQRAMQSLGDPDPEELEQAEQEYQTAVTISNDARATDFFRLGEIRENLKKIDEAIEAFTRSGQLGEGTVIKTYADQRIASLQKMKGQAPAKP